MGVPTIAFQQHIQYQTLLSVTVGSAGVLRVFHASPKVDVTSGRAIMVLGSSIGIVQSR